MLIKINELQSGDEIYILPNIDDPKHTIITSSYSRIGDCVIGNEFPDTNKDFSIRFRRIVSDAGISYSNLMNTDYYIYCIYKGEYKIFKFSHSIFEIILHYLGNDVSGGENSLYIHKEFVPVVPLNNVLPSFKKSYIDEPTIDWLEKYKDNADGYNHYLKNKNTSIKDILKERHWYNHIDFLCGYFSDDKRIAPKLMDLKNDFYKEHPSEFRKEKIENLGIIKGS